jgi:hypothetical protein
LEAVCLAAFVIGYGEPEVLSKADRSAVGEGSTTGDRHRTGSRCGAGSRICAGGA